MEKTDVGGIGIMLFNSFPFIFIFMPLCLGIYFWLGRQGSTTPTKAWLLLSSLIFYGYWKISFVPLLLLSIGVNFLLGKFLSHVRQKKKESRRILVLGMIFNLSLIAYYKYADFLLSFLPLPQLAGVLDQRLGLSGIILPLAISFYTFQQIAYLVDVFRGDKIPNYTILDYGLFVMFFPQLIAGPIVHHQEIIPQFNHPHNLFFSHRNFALGCVGFIIGLFKKVIIADGLSGWVALPFNNASELSFIEAWTAALSYTFQLYFDFSGYCDMALGIGLMLNIHLPINFDSPYKSTSIIEFWRRWHITLSNFLRDYLYIPLGGNRLGQGRQQINLMITMLLGGLWHGAGWTYIFWGGLHGLYLSINHVWKRRGLRLPKVLAWGATFISVVVGWVIFRAHSLVDAYHILWSMSGMNGILLPGKYRHSLGGLTGFGVHFNELPSLIYLPGGQESLVILAGLTLWVVFLPNTQDMLKRFKPRWWWSPVLTGIAFVTLLSMNRVSEFLYFQF